MQTSSLPKRIPTPFASSGSKQDIPVASQIGITGGRASYTDGFPPLTRTPLSAGGIPPFGTDFNGVLNDITAAIRWQNAGAGYPFDATFSTAIAGYPKGAVIPNSVGDGFWLNNTDANTKNPEVTDASLTGWVPVNNYGNTSITGLASSSLTLTSLQSAKNTLILSGALTSNINIVVPAWVKTWDVINNCTGSFSVTIKTPGGSGVAIAAGTNSRISGDGTNINLWLSPGSYINTQYIRATGTYTPTLGTKFADVEVQGAGGGGAGASATSSTTCSVGSGGNSGAYAIKRILNPVVTSVVVGTGGIGGVGAVSGNDGGVTSFGSIMSAPGGKGGKTVASSSAPVVSAASPAVEVGTGGDINLASGQGGIGTVANIGSGWPGTGAPSQFGPGAGGAYQSSGTDAKNPGTGGSGAHSSGGTAAMNGGKGADGWIKIREYA